MFHQNHQPDPSAMIGLGIAFFFGAIAYGTAKFTGPVFPMILCAITVAVAKLEKVYNQVQKETNPVNWVFPEWRYVDVKLSTQ